MNTNEFDFLKQKFTTTLHEASSFCVRLVGQQRMFFALSVPNFQLNLAVKLPFCTQTNSVSTKLRKNLGSQTLLFKSNWVTEEASAVPDEGTTSSAIQNLPSSSWTSENADGAVFCCWNIDLMVPFKVSRFMKRDNQFCTGSCSFDVKGVN